MSLRTIWGMLDEKQIFTDMDAGGFSRFEVRALALSPAVVFNPIECLFRKGSMPTRRAKSDVKRPSGSSRRLIASRSR